jgi:hypothetical protein
VRDACPAVVIELRSDVTALPKQAPADTLETLIVVPGRCLFFVCGNILICVWIGQADLAAAQANERAARTMARRYKTGRSFVGFILDGLPGPTPEAVPVFAKLMARSAELACIGYVLEGSGFWASGLRGMISNAHRESGAAARLRIATSAEGLSDWLSTQHAQHTGVTIQAAQLCAVLAKARAIAEAARR